MPKNIKILTAVFLAFYLLPSIGMGSDHLAPSSEIRPNGWEAVEHVVVIIFENGNPNEAYAQPYFNQLASQGAFLAKYHAVMHPSQPNYIAMIGGSNFDVFYDDNVTIDESHLGDLLESNGKSWKVYAEDFPGNCYLGETSGLYARKHVPFISFSNVQSNPERCNNIVSSSEFETDLALNQLPTYSLYIPNLDNDGHNTGLAFADNWLSTTLAPVLENQDVLKNTLFIITFDEDDYLHFNRIYTVYLGAGVNPGYVSEQKYNHYSTLRTVEQIFQLGDLGRNDQSADLILDVWQ